MKILYDGTIYSLQTTGGVNRYFANLICGLPHNFYPTLTSTHLRDNNYPQHPSLKIIFYKRFGFRPGKLSYWLEKYYFRTVARPIKFNLLHPTYYSLLTRQPMEKVKAPIILTIYDLVHEIIPQYADPDGSHSAAKGKAILAAQGIICISQNTKNDLLNRYKVSEDKVFVTYLASELNIALAQGMEPIPEQPYYIYVGNRYKYKNFDKLLLAFANISKSHPDLTLCVVGPNFNQLETSLIIELGLQKQIRHYEYASDHHLAKLYHHSIALVYPSMYEGFGIPLLEAMACETAVIASDRSSIPEVVGEAGALFNPDSIDDLSDLLILFYRDQTERSKLISKGRIRNKAFSWEKTVNQTVAIYGKFAA